MDDQTAERGGGMSRGDFMPPEMEHEGLRPLREHRVFITVFIISAMLTALILTYVYSERYRADAIVLFKSSDVNRISNHQMQAFGSPTPVAQFKTITQTTNALIGSDALLERVVRDLNLHVAQPRDFSGPWYIHYYKVIKYALQDYANDAWMVLKWGRVIEPDPIREAIVQLRKQIKVRNDDSYLYTIQVTAKTPRLAATLADRIAAVVTDFLHQDEQRVASRLTEDYITLRNVKLRELDEVGAKVGNLLTSNQIASIKDELEKITDRASKVQQLRTETLADLRQSDGKIAAAAEKLRVLSASAGEVDEDPVATRRRYSRMSPEDYAKISSKKVDSEVESGGLRARLASVDQSYAGLMPRLVKVTEVQTQYELLLAQLASAKRDYQALTDALEEATIRLTSAQSELRVVANAGIPEAPVSPIKIYHVPAAGALAALMAIGLAYVLDFFEIRLFLPPAGGRRRRLRPSQALAPTPDTVPAPSAAE